MCDVCNKQAWGVVLGARRQNLSRLRVAKLGCAVPAVARSSQLWSCVLLVLACRAVPAGLVTLGLFTLCGESLCRVPPPRVTGVGPAVVLCHPLCACRPQLGPFFACFVAFCSSLYPRVLSALGIFIHPLHCATALYLPKTAFATLSNLQSEDLTL